LFFIKNLTIYLLLL